MDKEYIQKIWTSLNSEERDAVNQWILANLYIKKSSTELYPTLLANSEDIHKSDSLPKFAFGNSVCCSDIASQNHYVMELECKTCSVSWRATGPFAPPEYAHLIHAIGAHLPNIIGKSIGDIRNYSPAMQKIHKALLDENYKQMADQIQEYGPKEFFKEYDRWMEECDFYGSEQADFFYLATIKFIDQKV